MSLSVNTYTGRGTALRYVDAEHSEEPFGSEVCRRELWGHPIMARLALPLLPSRKDADSYAEGEPLLTRLESEARLILARMAQVVADTKFGEEYVALRLQNLLRAIALAKELSGGVYIG